MSSEGTEPIFDVLDEYINMQIAHVQPNETVLFETENAFQKAWQLYQVEDFSCALNILNDLVNLPHLGPLQIRLLRVHFLPVFDRCH